MAQESASGNASVTGTTSPVHDELSSLRMHVYLGPLCSYLIPVVPMMHSLRDFKQSSTCSSPAPWPSVHPCLWRLADLWDTFKVSIFLKVGHLAENIRTIRDLRSLSLMVVSMCLLVLVFVLRMIGSGRVVGILRDFVEDRVLGVF